VCERDRAVHPDLQRWMAQRAARTASLDTDHSPFFSAPKDLLDLLLEAAHTGVPGD
jgi:hypothetical protein